MKQLFSNSKGGAVAVSAPRPWVRLLVISQILIWTPVINLQASKTGESFSEPVPGIVAPTATDDPEFINPNPLKRFMQSLDYNRPESREIVRRNADTIRLAARVNKVPDWMIATIIYVETAQGIPNAWHWNDAASRDLFVGFGRKTSMGVMQVQQDPADLGLSDHWQRMMFAQSYRGDETLQIFDGAAHLAAVLRQSNRLGRSDGDGFHWSRHKLRVVAHEYNAGPPNWRGTDWDDAVPLEYGELFIKFLPDAYDALYEGDLSDWPLPEIPKELRQLAEQEATI